jgi:hypothetical protein
VRAFGLQGSTREFRSGDGFRPGDVRSAVAESVLVKQDLMVMRDALRVVIQLGRNARVTRSSDLFLVLRLLRPRIAEARNRLPTSFSATSPCAR